MTSSFSQVEFEKQYQAGKSAFERGRYRSSIECFEQACQLVSPYSRLGGEVKMWLVNAYQAAGDTEKAIAVCQELGNHPLGEIKKQALKLLYIIKAPKLERPREWMTEIPDLNHTSDTFSKYKPINNPRQIKPKPQIELVDLTKVNTKDNQFIWLSLGVASLTIVSLFIL